MGLEAPSPAWPARDLPVGRGRGGAEPSKRPRAAWRRFDLPRPQRPPAGPDAGEYVLAGGRKGGDLAGSRTTTGAWRWPGWSPRAMAGQAAIDVFDKGAAARGAHPAPARPTTARPRAPAGAQSPPRPAGARALPGRRTPRRQSPCRPTTHGRQRALRPDPAPPPGPAAPGRLSRRAPGRRVDRFDHIYNTQRPHQGLPGRITPQQAQDAGEVARAPRPGHDTDPITPGGEPARDAPAGRRPPHRRRPIAPGGEREAGHHPQRAPTTSAASRSWSAAPRPGTEPPRSGTPPPSPSPTPTAGILIHYNRPPEGVTYVSHHPPDPTNQRARPRPQEAPTVTEVLTHRTSPMS